MNRNNPNPTMMTLLAVGVGVGIFFYLRRQKQQPQMSARQALSMEGTEDLYAHRSDQSAMMREDQAAEAVSQAERDARHQECASRGGRSVSELGHDGTVFGTYCVTQDAYTYYNSQCAMRRMSLQNLRHCRQTLEAGQV